MQSNYNKLIKDLAEGSREYLHLAKPYIQKRKLDKIPDQFQLGFIPNHKAIFEILEKRQWAASEAVKILLDLKLVYKKDRFGSLFSERIVFPIQNSYGEYIAIGGRVIDEAKKPKYFNSVFTKGNNLFGLNHGIKKILETNFAIIVEGYTDVTSSHRIGCSHIVSSMGTGLTQRHSVLLSRYAKHAFILFDSDKAGQNAAKLFMEKKALHPLAINVEPRLLPECKDLDEFIQQNPEKAKDFLERGIIKK